ncbi:hypothetical protein BK138_13935 [Paenibacillus rhizosphaerae]|uniref:Uncharacterized protein n=1 Tax=Paenibacillus rhizosphaerae TaxID=297318 RepID=A0A1R1ER27_9BACL|nr:hypothetical protein BK138_13935 [Paenibacillus rhizosphaerae]
MNVNKDDDIRWDGCAEIHVYSIKDENRDINNTFHTCDLKGMIDVLQPLNNVCKDYFGKGSYWEDTDDVKSV